MSPQNLEFRRRRRRRSEAENLPLMTLISFPSSELAERVPNIYSCFPLLPFTLLALLPSVSSFPPPNFVAADWKGEEPVFGLRKVHENSGDMVENDGQG